MRMLLKALPYSGEIEKESEQDRLLLHYAAASGDVELVNYFLSKGFSVNYEDENGNQPLHLAAIYKKKDVVPVLIIAGANVNAFSGKQVLQFSRSPLHYALTPAQHALEHKIPRKFQTAKQTWRVLEQPLYIPLPPQSEEYKKQVYDVFQMLLYHGADPRKSVSLHSLTTLNIASFYGPYSVVQLLLDESPSIAPKSLKFCHTPLHFATLAGHLDIVQGLVKISDQTRKLYGKQILKLALQHRHEHLYECLIEWLSVIDDGLAFYAVEQPDITDSEVVNFLTAIKRLGISVNCNRETLILHVAVQKRLTQTVRFLLENGASVTTRDSTKRTFLDWAIASWDNNIHLEMVKVILEYDVSSIIDAQDPLGNTVLHSCLSLKNREAVELLVEKGANVAIRNKKGLAPYELGFDPATEECLQLAYAIQQSTT